MTIQAVLNSNSRGQAPMIDDQLTVSGLGDLVLRVSGGVAAAKDHAETVDRDGRFPVEAIEAMRQHRLLALMVPRELGGDGSSLSVVADICYQLGRVCGSTAMIYAMHQTKLACIVRHGRGSPWHEELMRRLARHQLLMASSTTEGQKGGDVRSSAAPVERIDGKIRLDRAATVISYGAQADGLVTTARRAADAAASDQVLVVFLREDYTLNRLNGWDTLGMRGTCSAGFRLQATGSPEQILPGRYESIHAATMTPVSHMLWSSVWAGIAASAVERAQAFIRHAMRQAGGAMPPGGQSYSAAASSLRVLRALIATALQGFEQRQAALGDMLPIDVQTSVTMLKVEASELAIATVMSAMRATGLSGYRQDGAFSVGRQLRDILSSQIMIHNDRIIANTTPSSLLASVPRGLFA